MQKKDKKHKAIVNLSIPSSAGRTFISMPFPSLFSSSICFPTVYLPLPVQVIHIKRFRYTTFLREKLSTDVSFPLAGLDMSSYMSADRKRLLEESSEEEILHRKSVPVYDLIGVSHHSGSMNGGHYVAHVDTSCGLGGASSARWMCFNDSRVSSASASNLGGPSAYVLFYRRRETVSSESSSEPVTVNHSTNNSLEK